MNQLQNRIIFVVLIIVFGIYNVFIYTQKSSVVSVEKMSSSALAGEQLWQDNNCTACHQLYGLGGYLGPDLTNIASHPSKGEEYIKAFLNSGVNSMPKFNFDEQEKEQLVSFLSHVDKTGIYPNTNAVFSKDGWVEIEYKKD